MGTFARFMFRSLIQKAALRSARSDSPPAVDPKTESKNTPMSESHERDAQPAAPRKTESRDTRPPPQPIRSRFPRQVSETLSYIDRSRPRAPTSQAMIVDDLRLIYLPIAKNACSSTKLLVAKLGGLVLEPGQDIHQTLDTGDTGLQFKDHPEDHIRDAIAAPGWMRFMIFRDPMDRLVSAYVEKFVINRNDDRQWDTCRQILGTVLNKSDPTGEDFERGITFREFAEFILAQDPRDLDSHWQPQVFYMGHVPLTHIYDVRAMDRLVVDLQAHVGSKIELPRRNVSRKATGRKETLEVAADLLPGDLHNAERLSVESFLPRDLHRRLAEYYAADISIYHQIWRNTVTSVGDR